MGVIFSYLRVLGGGYIGWGVGANDSANIFGTAVATGSVRYKTAVILIAIFAFVGSVWEGPNLYDHVSFGHGGGGEISSTNMALAATVAAGTAVLIVTIMGIPASTSQAAIGGLMGVAILDYGFAGADWPKLGRMTICWVATPIGGAIVAYTLHRSLGWLIRRFIKKASVRNGIYRWGLIIFGSYGAYTLGANNVVVTTVSYYQAGLFGPVEEGVQAADIIAAAIGGLAISIGALTYSKRVMETVGKKITTLDPFSALVAVLSHSIALEIFTWLHVPVSSSQAIVGAVIGVGIVNGVRAVSGRQLVRIFLGWLATPVSACLLAMVLGYLIG